MSAYPPVPPVPPAPPGVTVTHLMLRVALAGVALAILLAVLVERLRSGCFLTSVSAYWYTDARAVFAGGLIAIAVCLVAYAGGTWTENLLLNLAGMLAPVVAFAPTEIGRDQDISCLGRTPAYDSVATSNGLIVYFVALLFGIVVTVIASASVRRGLGGLTTPQIRAARIGIGVGLASAGALAAWWALDDEFARRAHFPAAVVMFGYLTVVVACRTERVSEWTRRWDLYRDDDLRAAMEDVRTFPYAKVYAVLAGFMALTIAAAGVNLAVDVSAYGVIIVEVLLLLAFLTFWVLQTVQVRGLTRDGEPVTSPGDDPSDDGPSSRRERRQSLA